jgi:hypothetical protein
MNQIHQAAHYLRNRRFNLSLQSDDTATATCDCLDKASLADTIKLQNIPTLH